jgi:hypothetical protein
VKIRGTAAHIAEKYMSLARDALASGDMVTAESYLQHAEHYNRIIMAAQSQMGGHQGHQGEGPNGGGFRPRWNAEASDEEGGEFDGVEGGGDIRGGGAGSGEFRQGGGGEIRGSQDRERHEGNREHHGGREHGRRHDGNGSDGGCAATPTAQTRRVASVRRNQSRPCELALQLFSVSMAWRT